MKRLVVVMVTAGIIAFSAGTATAAREPESSSLSQARPAARSECGHKPLPPLDDNLTGEAADRLENLQSRYEEAPGFLGVVSAGGEAWVVVDPTVDRAFWEQGVASAGAAHLAVGCVHAEAVEEVKALVAAAAHGRDDFSSVSYNVFTDSVDVITSLDAASLADELGAKGDFELTSMVRVVESEAGSVSRMAGRLADTAPFFGGARISLPLGGCSTGFYLNSATRGTVMLTAGHCASNGTTVRNWNDTLTVGVIEGRSLPNPDLAVIDGQSYAARSFSANDNTSSKAISNAVNPTTGATYCQLGGFSYRICSTYSSLNAQFCDASGCTNDLAFTSRDCTLGTLVRPGDSGGGVFREADDGTLGARGIVVAGGRIGTGAQCARYDHRLPTILDWYDAAVVIIE